jgi:hypothetical protein
VRLVRTTAALARASGAGGYSGRGTAITWQPAAAAERSPLDESYTAAAAVAATASRSVTVR